MRSWKFVQNYFKNNLMEFDKNKALEYYQQELSITAAAKKHCKDLGIPYEERYRHRLSKHINSSKDTDVETTTEIDTNQYSNDKFKKTHKGFNAINENGTMMSIEEYCEHYNLDYSKIRSWKSVTHTAIPYYNIAFHETVVDVDQFDYDLLEEVVSKNIQPAKVESIELNNDEDYFDRLVISDIHIGMSTEGGRNIKALYDTPWNKEELFIRLEKTVDHVLKYRKGNILIIDELGDYVDGLFGQTTRKGHVLPQNMSDKDCFDIGVAFKILLVDKLVPYYNKIICNSVVEDNHSGVFGYFISSAVKSILEKKYPDNVNYNVLEKFINHYTIGKHTFILSHGKDSESLKFGFKPVLDKKQADKIDQYCKEYRLYQGNYIEFSKGDSHQFLFDHSTSQDFSYCNYPAFSPPSNWVKSNFGMSTEACVFQNISYTENIKITIPLIF